MMEMEVTNSEVLMCYHLRDEYHVPTYLPRDNTLRQKGILYHAVLSDFIDDSYRQMC